VVSTAAGVARSAAGAVLTGGASRRMGRDKATLPVDGRAMGERVADALRSAGLSPVFCVGGSGLPGLELVADPGLAGRGPMSGILGALGRAAASGASIVVVLACDLPGASAVGIGAVLAALHAAPDSLVAVPVLDGRIEPLHAAWRVEALDIIAPDEPAVHRVIASLPHVEVGGLDPAWLRNVNRPEDLDPDRDPRRAGPA
jgi:molybdopterin-guanine dinucleotide biosynthesis protein A